MWDYSGKLILVDYLGVFMKVNGVELCDSERQKCEIWTRVMGYYRPVENYNSGKQSEYKERKCFKEVSFNDGSCCTKTLSDLDNNCCKQEASCESNNCCEYMNDSHFKSEVSSQSTASCNTKMSNNSNTHCDNEVYHKSKQCCKNDALELNKSRKVG